MNTIAIALLGLTGVCLLFGFLFGLSRGLNRSILRFILVAASAAAAFMGREKVIDAMMEVQVNGQPLTEMMTGALPDGLSKVTDMILPIIQIIVGIVLFLVAFLILQFITWLIVYPICKIFVRKGRHKKALAGGLVGLLQGALVAFVLCVPLNGLVTDTVKLTSVDLKVDGFDLAETLAPAKEVGLDETYLESPAAKIYGKIGSAAYNQLASVKNSEGKVVTLSVQMDVISSTMKMAGEIMKITDKFADISLDNVESISDIKEMFANLDAIKADMTPEAKEAFTETVKDLAGSLTADLGVDLPIDLESIDLMEVNFTNEISLVETALNYKDAESMEDVDVGKLVTDLSQSDLILPIIAESEVTLDLEEDQKNEVAAEIAKLPATTEEEQQTINQLKALFGIVD